MPWSSRPGSLVSHITSGPDVAAQQFKISPSLAEKENNFTVMSTFLVSSSETQGQIVGARESLNGGEKQCLTRQFQTVAAVLPSDWAEKHKRFLAPIRRQNDGDRLELVW